MKKQSRHFGKIISLALLALALVSVIPASAQGYNSNDNYVTVYKDCSFRGEARNVPIGDYQDMGSVQMRNDSISSIRIPRGLEITLYQHERFGGFSTTFDRDINCLGSDWNDQASSLQIHRGRDGNSSYGNNYDDRGYFTQANVTAKNLSRAEFAGTVLEKSGSRQWRLTNRNGQATQFRELSKNENAVYLESTRNRERVRIDFFTNDVTILTRNGETASYPLLQALRTNDRYQAARVAPVTTPTRPNQNRPASNIGVGGAGSKSGQLTGNCFNYRAYSNGGNAGIRFNVGDTEFKRFNSRPQSGRICHQGSVEMEVNKTEPNTEVTVEIQGQIYKFAANEAHDVYRNNWYRKKINLSSRR